MYFKWKLFAFQLNIIFMFMIIIQVFKMDINCILMKYYLMFMIIIHVFQMDIFCVLMKYYFHVYDHNSCISNVHYLHFNEILFSCL